MHICAYMDLTYMHIWVYIYKYICVYIFFHEAPTCGRFTVEISINFYCELSLPILHLLWPQRQLFISCFSLTYSL